MLSVRQTYIDVKYEAVAMHKSNAVRQNTKTYTATMTGHDRTSDSFMYFELFSKYPITIDLDPHSKQILDRVS